MDRSICHGWTGHAFAAAPGGVTFGTLRSDQFVRFTLGDTVYDVETLANGATVYRPSALDAATQYVDAVRNAPPPD